MTDDTPVRLGRFEWERLVLMCVPHPKNFKLLPIGVFMSADGGRARPGNRGLAMFGPHEKTWASLLRWAVAEGWLTVVYRGGARRGPNGTTIVRASVYAASVPREVWDRRLDVLGAPPFRSAGVEGSDEGSGSEPLKGAPEGSVHDPDVLKGALGTPFNGSDPSLKGASGDSLPDPLKGAIESFEGSDPSFEGSVSVFEGSAQGLPHHVVLSSRSNSSSTSTTSVAEVSSITLAREDGTEGGGGGDSSFPEASKAEALVDALDYRGRAPGRKKREALVSRVAAALAAGWTEQDLKVYLDLGGGAVDSAVALYLYRLDADELPDAQTFRAAQSQALTGTDDTVAGWFDLSRQLGQADGGMWDRAMGRAQARMDLTGTDANFANHAALVEQMRREEAQHAPATHHRPSTTDQRVQQALDVGRRLQARHDAQQERGGHQPYSDSTWHELDRQARNGEAPAGADKYPHCGHPDCDPITRTRERRDENGIPSLTPCSKCHPALKF